MVHHAPFHSDYPLSCLDLRTCLERHVNWNKLEFVKGKHKSTPWPIMNTNKTLFARIPLNTHD